MDKLQRTGMLLRSRAQVCVSHAGVGPHSARLLCRDDEVAAAFGEVSRKLQVRHQVQNVVRALQLHPLSRLLQQHRPATTTIHHAPTHTHTHTHNYNHSFSTYPLVSYLQPFYVIQSIHALLYFTVRRYLCCKMSFAISSPVVQECRGHRKDTPGGEKTL